MPLKVYPIEFPASPEIKTLTALSKVSLVSPWPNSKIVSTLTSLPSPEGTGATLASVFFFGASNIPNHLSLSPLISTFSGKVV